MPGLTAKVFRTYNASNTLLEELNKNSKKLKKLGDSKDDISEKIRIFEKANEDVAILCNHKVGATIGGSDTIKEELSQIKKKIKEKEKEGKNPTSNLLKRKRNLEKALEIGGKLSCTTSKTNYIDPRIVVAFTEKYDVPLKKLFSKALLDKFKWAIDTTPKTWNFYDEDIKKRTLL